MQVPRYLLDSRADLGHIAEAYAVAEERQGPTALLIGVTTV